MDVFGVIAQSTIPLVQKTYFRILIPFLGVVQIIAFLISFAQPVSLFSMDHQWSVDHQYLSTEGLSKRISGVSEPKLVTPGYIVKSVALKDRYKVHHSSHD